MNLSWRKLNYLFLTSNLFDQVGKGHLVAFTPLLLAELGLSLQEIAVWTGLLYAIGLAIAFPLTPFWGVLAERYSRRLVIIRTYYIEAFAFLLFFFAQDLSWLIGARVIMGLSFGTVATVVATQAMLTPREKVGSAVATVQSAQPIAASLGPPLGALLIPWIGLRGVFLLDAVLLFSAGLLVTFLLRDNLARDKNQPILRRVREVFAQVWREPPLRWNFISALAVRGATATVDTYLPVRITQVVTTDPANAIGLILGIYGALTAFATWLVGRLVDRVNEARLFVWAMVVATGLTAGLALAPNVWVLGILAAMRSAHVALTNTVLFAHLARVLPRSQQTAVMSLSPFPRTTGALLLPLIAAAVAPIAVGAALGVGVLGYACAGLAGRRMAAVTRSRPRRLPESLSEKFGNLGNLPSPDWPLSDQTGSGKREDSDTLLK